MGVKKGKTKAAQMEIRRAEVLRRRLRGESIRVIAEALDVGKSQISRDANAELDRVVAEVDTLRAEHIAAMREIRTAHHEAVVKGDADTVTAQAYFKSIEHEARLAGMIDQHKVRVKHSGKVGVEGQSVVRFEFVESADGKPADQETEADEKDGVAIDPGRA